jgi:BlaI family penicillinase repressor
MPRPRSVGPTEGELEILQVFWRKKTATAREVSEALAAKRQVAGGTVRSMIRLMTAKGLIVPEGKDRPQRYRAAADRDVTRDQILKTLVKRFFGGSTKNLLMHFFAKETTRTQIEEAERLQKDME